MRVVNIQNAKTHLSRLVDEALAGESIVIARAGRPQVKLVPCRSENAPRKPGDWKGKLWLSDDFDQTDPEVVRLFEDGDGLIKRPAKRSDSPTSRAGTRKSPRRR